MLKQKIKPLSIFICLSVVVVLWIPFISTLFHELSHFIWAKTFGFSNAISIIKYPFGGQTNFNFPESLPFSDPQWVQLKIITIAGSLGGSLSMGLLNTFLTLYKKIPFSVSLPFFGSTLTMITNEILYWFNGVNRGSDLYDAYRFINIPPQINSVVVQYFTLFFGFIILILLFLGLIIRIKETVKKNLPLRNKILKKSDQFFFILFILFYLGIMYVIINSFILYTKPLFSLYIS